MTPSAEPTDHLTPAVRKAHDELVSVIRWINERSEHMGFPGDPRNMIAGACFDLVLEHQAAIAVLVERELNGSAMSLMRVMAEAFIRGMWFHWCATDAELARFQRNDELDKRIRTLASEVEAALGNKQDAMSRVVRDVWGALCSYTHTGLKQVARRYTGAQLKSSYAEHEVVSTLFFARAIGLLAVMGLAGLSQNVQLAAAALQRSKA
jgi:hypothetical protein